MDATKKGREISETKKEEDGIQRGSGEQKKRMCVRFVEVEEEQQEKQGKGEEKLEQHTTKSLLRFTTRCISSVSDGTTKKRLLLKESDHVG